MSTKNILSLLPFLALVFLIEWAGSWLTFTSVGGWYLTLVKPAWNPPAWVFGPVWTILYVMIAVSGWLVAIRVRSSPKKQFAFVIYGLQLFSNLLWSFCFFYLQSPVLAFGNILVLLVLIASNMVLFRRLYRNAGRLLVPYFIWTLYAAILNGAIWAMNR